MIKHFILLLCLLLIAGCRVRYVEIPVVTERVKVEYKTNSQRDSVYIADTVHTYTRGDTIYRDKVRYKVKYVSVIDTVHTADTVYRDKVVKVNGDAKRGARSLMDWLGLASTIILFFVFLFWVWRKLRFPLR